MKNVIATIGQDRDVLLRAGVISSLVLALCYLYVTGLSSLPRAWAFMIMIAFSFVLMMKSVVDLLICMFGFAARYSGFGLGRAVRLFRRAGLR